MAGIAVVTGGAQGIGGNAADILAAHGWTVHALDLKPNPDADIRSHTCDVTSEEAQMALAEEIGPIDALVCCAGINLRPDDHRAEQLTLEAWHKT